MAMVRSFVVICNKFLAPKICTQIRSSFKQSVIIMLIILLLIMIIIIITIRLIFIYVLREQPQGQLHK
jgi:hypothetical protein